MRRALATAVLLVAAGSARADDVSGNAQLQFQKYDVGASSMTGFRQTYDLRLSRAFAPASSFRIFFRGDDFRGTNSVEGYRTQSHTRQLQPAGELSFGTDKLQANVRGERIHALSDGGSRSSTTDMDRYIATLNWQPEKLPSFFVTAQRNGSRNEAAGIALTDDNAVASTQYTWRGLNGSLSERFSRSVEELAGYERKNVSQDGTVSYATSAFGGKLGISATAVGTRMELSEHASGSGDTAIPTPVAAARALWSVDDSPLNSTDHPGASASTLIDGNINRITVYTLGPEAASFQNFVLDLARIDRVDEIQIIVRDAAGNPLQHGGGSVLWDAYISQDGVVWTLVPSATTAFNPTLSLYSVTFPQTPARWFKVVNFGVNSDATFVTELVAFLHRRLLAGASRNATQTNYNGGTAINFQATRKLSFFYSGAFNTFETTDAYAGSSTTSDHFAGARYDLPRSFSVQAGYSSRRSTGFSRPADTLEGIDTMLEYAPRDQLRLGYQLTRQTQTFLGVPFTVVSHGLHAHLRPLRSIDIMADAGTQTQAFTDRTGTAQRTYASLIGNVQLYPTMRMTVNGTLQRMRSDVTDEAVQLLGAARDNRVSAELTWRPGSRLVFGGRIGWMSSEVFSGMTERVHFDWYPLGDGAVSIGGSFDEDIDPVLNRRARRAVFNPRWTMNRFTRVEVSYSAFQSQTANSESQQKILVANVILSR